MGDAVEGDAEGGAAPGCEGWLDFDQRAISGASEGSEDPVDTLQRKLAIGFGQAASRDILSEDDRWWSLALNTRREDFFGDHFGGGAGEAADEAGEGALSDAAVRVLLAHRE